MLNIRKTTPSGRFTVQITSVSSAGQTLTVGEIVHELHELATVLTDAAQTAVNLAMGMLDGSVGVGPRSD